MDDRTELVRLEEGESVLPCCSLFNRLLRFAYDRPPKIAIRDADTGKESTYLQLLTDVVALRIRLRQRLGAEVLSRIEAGNEVYVAVLAGGGYEYAVAMLVVLALGAAVVPLTVALPPEEAFYYANRSRSVAVLSSTAAIQKGVELEELVRKANSQSSFFCLPIGPSTLSSISVLGPITSSTRKYLDDNGPGVVIFTSGTTGPPKGSVMRRAYAFDGALSIADQYDVTSSDVVLHQMPVHHATGVGIMFFPFLISGALIEFKSGGFDPEWTWNRWRRKDRNRLTFFSGVPTIYMRMMRYFEQNLAHSSDVSDFVEGARDLRACLCGTSALPKPIADFWTEILGRKILLRYGATEFSAPLQARMGDESIPDGSVGGMVAGVDIKLSEGDQGEVLIKSPYMFSKYLNDPAATRSAHDDQGYFKSGDIARREGDYYWILGRASVDIIKSGGYKISALDIEREILALPYIAEVTVVGVEDLEFGQRVAAAIVLRDVTGFGSIKGGLQQTELTIDRLRRDLGGRLARYKMPTLLRLVHGELPKSQTGKISKKTLGPQLFPENYRALPSVQVWEAKGGNSGLKARL